MALADITIKQNLRPCLVNDKKALFHCWHEYSNVIDPSPLIGGHSGGQLKILFGIIEDETGQIYKVNPTEIRFIDNKIQEYNFDEDNVGRCEK